jgi:predicted outer membrane protein
MLPFLKFKKYFMKFFVILFVSSLFAACRSENNAVLNGTDQYFLQTVTYANHNEIAAGQLASSMGTVDSVKYFGELTAADYTSAQVRLDSIATQLHFQLQESADSSHLIFDQQLQNLSGLIFDTTYLDEEVRNHQVLLVTFNDEIAYGNNQQVKNYANDYLLTVEANLQMALRLQKNIH